jgi:hypothetical protein
MDDSDEREWGKAIATKLYFPNSRWHPAASKSGAGVFLTLASAHRLSRFPRP